MYCVKIKVKKSNVEGKGVFANESIKKGAIVWKFEVTHDKTMSVHEHATLNQEQKDYIDKIAYLSAFSNRYIFPPENDPAKYTNHDAKNNNLSVRVDQSISSEPFFVANRDISEGEELTNNYHEFDEAIKSKTDIPEWLK